MGTLVAGPEDLPAVRCRVGTIARRMACRHPHTYTLHTRTRLAPGGNFAQVFAKFRPPRSGGKFREIQALMHKISPHMHEITKFRAGLRPAHHILLSRRLLRKCFSNLIHSFSGYVRTHTPPTRSVRDPLGRPPSPHRACTASKYGPSLLPLATAHARAPSRLDGHRCRLRRRPIGEVAVGSGQPCDNRARVTCGCRL